MKKFTIKVTYDAVAYIDVVADSEENAIKEMDLNMIPKSSVCLRARKWNVSSSEDMIDDLDSMIEKVNKYFSEHYVDDYYEFADYETIKYLDDEENCIESEVLSISYDTRYDEITFELDNNKERALSQLDSSTQYNICKLIINNLSL